MAKPTATLPEWATTANYGASVYPSTVIGTPTTASTSMAAWIAAVSAATAVAAPSDFGEIDHPSAGGATPWSGAANKEATGLTAFANTGAEPGVPIKAESLNEWLNRIWQYTDWLRLASASAGLDDHVMQTDATGKTAVARVELGGTAYAGSPLTATSNASGAAATFTDTVGSYAATFSAGGALAAIRSVQTSSGPAIDALLVGGTDYAIQANAGSAGAGAIFADGGSGTAYGIEAESGATGGHAILGTAKTGSSSSAIRGIGSSTASTSYGVFGTAVHDDALGVYGVTSATANAGAAGVYGRGLGGGDGVIGRAAAGHGVIAWGDETSPLFAALAIVPADDIPTSTATGDVWALDNGDPQPWLMWRSAADKYLHHGTYPRQEDAYAYDGTGNFDNTIATAVSTTFEAATGGDVIITVRAGLAQSTAPGDVDYLIESADDGAFTTNVQSHESAGIYVVDHASPSTNSTAYLCAQIKDTPLTTSDRYYRLRFTNYDSSTCYFSDASIRIEGEFA